MSWFWQAMLLAIFVIPVILLFGYAVLDVIRRPGPGFAPRALWLIAFCVLPIVGPLVYLVINPPGSREMEERLAGDETSRTSELQSLASLHDQGKLTDEEFRQMKEQSITGGMPGSVREQRGGQLL
jgi:Short C-terminal domain/Phospholipase_D-nuclease N-terminal